MDYQRVQDTRLTILYPLRFRKSIRGYFSDNVASAVDIGIDFTSVRCAVESTLHALPAKRRLLTVIAFRVIHGEQAQNGQRSHSAHRCKSSGSVATGPQTSTELPHPRPDR